MAQSAVAPGANNNCFGLKMPYGLGENYVAANMVFRGLLDAFEYTGRAARPVVTETTELFCTGGSNPVTGFQTTGPRLNQRNGDIFLELTRRALQMNFGPNDRIRVCFAADDMLAAIGKPRGQHNREWLTQELSCMKRASFLINFPKLKAWEFNLLNDIVRDDSTRKLKAPAYYEVELNAEMVHLFVQGGWSFIDGRVLRKLYDAQDLFARALYLYYATHRVLPVKHESDLQGVFHREAMDRKDWLALLRRGLDAVRNAAGWKQFELARKAFRSGNKRIPKGQVLVQMAPPKAVKAAADETATLGAASTVPDTPDTPLVRRAIWLESLSLTELTQLIAAMGLRMQVEGEGTVTDEQATTFLREELMGCNLALADLQDKLATAQPDYLDI